MIQSKSGTNTLVFIDEEKKHEYQLNGKPVISVTAVKQGHPTAFNLISWMIGEGSKFTIEQLKQFPEQVSRLPDYLLEEIVKKSKGASKKIAKEAASIGSLVHEYVELLEAKVIDNQAFLSIKERVQQHKDKDKIENCIKEFHKWKETNHDQILAQENIIASVKHQYAGKFDRLAKRDGKILLQDFKTSSGVYTEHLLQVGGGYNIALEEWEGIKVDGVEIIVFTKDGDFKSKLVTKEQELNDLKYQFIRDLETYQFDKRWEWKK